MTGLHPECADFLDALARLDIPTDPRERYRFLCARFTAPPPANIAVHDRPPLRWYKPPSPTAALVWLHGGRFVSGDLDTHDSLCQLLAHSTRRTVIAVDYRLAPEHSFPAATEDAAAALLDVAAQYDRIAIGGDSAGAALALTTALESGIRLDALILVYPMIDATCHLPSHAEFEDGPGPSSLDMRAGWAAWLPPGADRRSPRVSPLFAEDLSVLPRTLLVTAGRDPLRDEGQLLAARITQTRVPLTEIHYPNHIHGFITYPAASAAARRTIQSCATFLPGSTPG
jgi:acetyl esterase